MPKISERGRDIPSSPIRKLAPLATEARSKGVKVYPLNIGQPDLPTPQVALDAIHNIDRTVLEYSPSEGLLSYRQKLVNYYVDNDIKIEADDIIVMTGGSEAILLSFLATLNPGDEVIIPEPVYANYITFAKSCGASICPVSSSIESGFALPSVDEFEKKINPHTKGILICNPNNPTGYVYTAEEMEQIRQIVKKHDLFLYSDEVYREFIYNDQKHISALNLKEIEDNVIMIDSVSKRYSSCGIRIGAAVTRNKELRATIMKFCQARLSPPLIGQIASEAAIDAGENYMHDNFEEYKQRRDFLIEGLNKIPGVFSPMPNGAFYTVVRLPIDDSDKFCAWCLSDFQYEGETVFMAPASGFYITPELGKNEVRMAYVIKKEELARALVVLEKALEAYPGRTN